MLDYWDFPGGPIVKTPYFQWRWCGLDPWSETKIPHTAWHNQKQTILDYLVYYQLPMMFTKWTREFSWKSIATKLLRITVTFFLSIHKVCIIAQIAQIIIAQLLFDLVWHLFGLNSLVPMFIPGAFYATIFSLLSLLYSSVCWVCLRVVFTEMI